MDAGAFLDELEEDRRRVRVVFATEGGEDYVEALEPELREEVRRILRFPTDYSHDDEAVAAVACYDWDIPLDKRVVQWVAEVRKEESEAIVEIERQTDLS